MAQSNWMKGGLMAAAGLLMSAGIASAQSNQVPIDLSAHYNVDGFYIENGDPFITGQLGLDAGGARVRTWTLPATFVDGQPNATADGRTVFLLGPTSAAGQLDSYRPEGEILDIANAKYDFLYIAAMSGNGEFPGSAWADKDTMTFNYAGGTTGTADIGTVNDWFWTPPKWVAPTSGSANDILVNLVAHNSDINEFDYLFDWSQNDIASQSHDYGKYRYANGEDYLVYELPYEAGAKLYLRSWGNMKIEISTEDPANGTTMELFNSRTVYGKVFPGGGDGYMPAEYNDKVLEFDLSTHLPTGTDTFYLRFSDAAPGEATGVTGTMNWGARVAQIGVFKGAVVESRLGDRLWPGLVRTDGNAPSGGLQLIRKGYRLDNTKELDSITMPNLFPNASPFLTIFGMTLVQGDIATGVQEFMLY